MQIALPPGEYDVTTLLLDASSVVSGLWLISDPPGAAWLRAAGSDLLTTTPAAPPLWVRGLRLRGRVHIDGSRANFENCSFEESEAVEGESRRGVW